MNAFALLILLLLGKSFSVFKTENQGIYFRGLFCNLSEKFIYPNFSCRAKSFNRSTSTVTALVTPKKPLNDIFLQISFDYKYGNIYRDVLHTPRIDVCQLIKAAHENKLLGELILNPSDLPPSAFRTNVEQLVHECPYQSLRVRDFLPQLQQVRVIFPSGDYRSRYTFTTKNEEFMGLVSVFITMNSSDKNSFG